MQEKINHIVNHISSFIPYLEKQRSQTKLGALLKPYRFTNLMRNFTYKNEPQDCLLFAYEELQKGEKNLGEALKWLYQAENAYRTKEHLSFEQKLGEAICQDIMVQLNGINLINMWQAKQEADAKQTTTPSDELKSTNKLLSGLLAYHLGYGQEINDAAITAYQKLLTQTQDVGLVEAIKERIAGLSNYDYLNAADLNLSQEEFTELTCNPEKVQTIINQYCLESHVQERPKYDEKITKAVFDMAWPTVFIPPVAIFVIPLAYLSTPLFKLADWINYNKDQSANDSYYKVLDAAHVWVENNIKKEALKLAPHTPTVLAELINLEARYKLMYQPLEKRDLDEKLRTINNLLIFRKNAFDDNKYSHLKNILQMVEANLETFKACKRNAEEILYVATHFINYLQDARKQLQVSDGKFHSLPWLMASRHESASLKDLATILASYEKEYELNCNRGATLANDCGARLNNVKAEIDAYMADKRAVAQNSLKEVDGLKSTVRKSYM